MSAAIIPFPRTRNSRFVFKHAARLAGYTPATAEKHLTYQLDLQRKTMKRRGIAPATVAAEVEALESAIRRAMWRSVLIPGGAVR